MCFLPLFLQFLNPMASAAAPPPPSTFAVKIGRALHRTLTWIRARPMQSTAAVLTVVGASLVYEARVTHGNRIPSPTVRNHLEYDMDTPADPRQSSTMKVTQGHISVREGHWQIRNAERNWSIMAQDIQKQKDSTPYRLERSKDDDFGRLTASKV